MTAAAAAPPETSPPRRSATVPEQTRFPVPELAYQEFTQLLAAPDLLSTWRTPPRRSPKTPTPGRTGAVTFANAATYLGVPASVLEKLRALGHLPGDGHKGFTPQELAAAKKMLAKSMVWKGAVESTLNGNDAATLLGVGRTRINTLTQAGALPVAELGSFKWGSFNLYRVADLLTVRRSLAKHVGDAAARKAARTLAATVESPRHIVGEFGGVVRIAAPKPEPSLSRSRQRLQEMLRVALRDRRTQPESVHLHLGPTNSGKTHDALEAPAVAGRGAYVAPLRMLAAEAYEKLCARLGKHNVGLLTGEEQIRPQAPVVCCTAEMAPTTGHMLVLDEAHWVHDPDRGYAWARLLAGGTYTHMHIIAAPEARDLLGAAFADVPADRIQVSEHVRRSKLTWIDTRELDEVEPGTLVVAFSRKAVHALTRDLLESGKKAGALYGALPPAARRAQIAAFVAGTLDVLVTTDVIGHGINLPATTVLMAETTKFDGVQRRNLGRGEAAQIVGRAGRGTTPGQVGTLGHRFLHAQTRLVRGAVDAAAGKTGTGLHVTRGQLRPTYADLGAPALADMAWALAAWATKAAAVLADHPWLSAAPVATYQARARMLTAAARRGTRVNGEAAWKLITLPVDANGTRVAARHVRTDRGRGRRQGKAHLLPAPLDGRPGRGRGSRRAGTRPDGRPHRLE